jgi:phenylacetate-CoA oxygenase PaaH subunit
MSDTQWETYEVFHQSKKGDPHISVGTVHAPDPEMALQMARDQFARRLKCVSLWVVRTIIRMMISLPKQPTKAIVTPKTLTHR